jgi:hypothetical protein
MNIASGTQRDVVRVEAAPCPALLSPSVSSIVIGGPKSFHVMHGRESRESGMDSRDTFRTAIYLFSQLSSGSMLLARSPFEYTMVVVLPRGSVEVRR